MDGPKIFPIEEGRLPNMTTTESDKNMLELATHIVTSAPPDVLEEFSVSFLVQSFKNDPETFEKTWEKYQEQQLEQHSNIIKFPVNKEQNVN